MIIAFYPGGGGNRFYQWLNGRRLFDATVGYDRENPYQAKINRYPTHSNQSQLLDFPCVFTHCMNYNFIVQCWPGHDQVYFVSADIVKSLRRQWTQFQRHTSNNQHPAGGPYSTIAWHHAYYTQYPHDPGAGIVVDHSSYPEFDAMLKHELENTANSDFDFAQQVFEQHGANAPIIDLYNQYNDNK